MIKQYIRTFICTAALLLMAVAAWCADIRLENRKVRFTFDAGKGSFLRMEDLAQKRTVGSTAGAALWEMTIGGKKVSGKDFSRFTHRMASPGTLVMEWKGLAAPGNNVAVKVTVRLRDGEALSDWHLAVEGLNGTPVPDIVFPMISGLPNTPATSMAAANWMGELLDNPGAQLKKPGAKFEWFYPGHLSMQLMAVYNRPGGGLYAAADDAKAYRKNMGVQLGADGKLVYYMVHYPAQDADVQQYSMPYNAVIGAFSGDWISAAEIYREWGEQQEWCAQSRLRTGKVADWLKETALWVWNRGRASEVLQPATDLQQRLGLPVNVLWHWWHGCSYDDGFPEYVPPRDGRELFMEEVKKAQQYGVRSLVYMNQIQWGNSTASWQSKGAEKSSVKDANGQPASHVYNIFTGKALTNMCIVTDFWKKTYSDLCDTVINTYGVNGVYMDQTCLTRMCYDPSHHHPIGGGNYWVQHSGKLTEQIRSTIHNGQQVTLSGEGVGEAWMPYVDAFLALQVSRERYAGVHGWQAIPFFQVVYHPYSLAYGNYSSLLTPPYDEKWPEAHRPANMLQPLDPAFNRQFLMEQARSFAWGMQPMISNYKPLLATERKAEVDYLLQLAKVRNNGLKYLLHGRFQRAPAMVVPEENFPMSRLSIYAGQKDKVTSFEKKYPVIYHSAWKADDGSLGIAIASVRNAPYNVNMQFKAGAYGLPAKGKIYLAGAGERRLLGSYTGGAVKVNFEMAPKAICLVEVEP
jgi:hypothetical protein